MIQSGIPQNLIPVVPFIRRQASFEDQITPSYSEGDARDNFANHPHQLASRVIGVDARQPATESPTYGEISRGPGALAGLQGRRAEGLGA